MSAKEAPIGGPSSIAASKQDHRQSTAQEEPAKVEDTVALGAFRAASARPLPGARALWRSSLRACDGDIAAALGMLLVRLSQLEREAGR